MWRPGDPAPRKSKGAKKKGKKGKRAGGDGPERGGAERDGKGREESGADEDFIKTPAAPAAFSTGSDRAGAQKRALSTSLKGMKFMARKEEEQSAARAEAERLRKLREEKWVIDPALLESSSGKLVCQPLRTAPRPALGRRSFGMFNAATEEFARQRGLEAKADLVAAAVERDAIGPDEMAEHLGKRFRDDRGAGRGSKKRKQPPPQQQQKGRKKKKP